MCTFVPKIAKSYHQRVMSVRENKLLKKYYNMRKHLLTTILAMVALLSANTLQAQTTWVGTEINSLDLENGQQVFLYNVGTGRFMIHGGDWGTGRYAAVLIVESCYRHIIWNGNPDFVQFFDYGRCD